MDDQNGKRQWQRKRTMICGTWNIQGIRTKVDDILQEIKKHKLDFIALSETKKKGQGTQTLGEYIHIYSGVNKEEHAKRGISLLIHEKYKKNVSSWEAISDRTIKVNVNLKGCKITIIATYGPNEDARVDEKEKYYETLNELISQTGNDREIIILGDLNARTGKETKHEIIGPYGENTRNDNGSRLIDVCQHNLLRIMNGYFKHKEIHTYTWTQITRNLRSIIDYLIMKQKTKIKVHNVRVYRSAECGSDHHLIKAKLIMPIIKDNKQKNQLQNSKDLTDIDIPNYNIESLMNESTKLLYQQRLDQNLPQEYEQEPTDNLTKVVIDSIHKAAKEALGYKEMKKRTRNYWWTEQLQNLKEQKQRLYHTWLSTKKAEHKEQYSEAVSKFKTAAIEAKNLSWENKCKELDTYLGGRQSRESWRFIDNVRSGRKENIPIGTISPNKWQDYYRSLLREQRSEYSNMPAEDIRITGEPIKINVEKTKKAITLLKNGRAPGPEGIPAELIKCSAFL
ncbi:craniofacial development protein 2-like [Diorhabda sublineata]|uniref:craniofacial development protein 2-like n=1 Tax=Diorhabda sublineata TaxID=1163346 RepID=UPI0024E19305|nr:craniofacial development protein 2-like [Diorhabda sublineata]